MKKKIIAAIFIVLLLVTAIAVVIIGGNKKQQGIKDGNINTKKETIILPGVDTYLGTQKTATLIGYTMQMDVAFLRDNLSVVTTDNRKLELKISKNKNQINQISYEIRTTDGERLIDNGEVSGYDKESQETSVTVPISTILQDGEEYSLTIVMETKAVEKIYYYTRIVAVDKDFLSNQIKFAKEFSDKTLDSDNASSLAIYLEPDTSLVNNNLGKVTLKSNYDLLSWGDLTPKKTTDTAVTLKEICIKENGYSGTYQMTYNVKAKGSADVEDVYNIIETITVWTYQNEQYVLAYERHMNQIWQADENTVNNKFLDLGIQDETTVDFTQSKEGKYIAYVVNGQLWMLDVQNKKMIKVLSIDEKYNDNSDIITSALDDNGNLNFIICGYNTSSDSMGKNGISICKYDMQKNKVTELLFIPYDKPCSILKNEVNRFCYLNDNVLYLMIEKDIYYVNLETKENGVIAKNLKDSNYAINLDKNTIAYNTNGNIYGDSITIVNLSNSTQKVIEAENNSKIKVCGYSGNNLVYGVIPKSKVKKNSKESDVEMSTIIILDQGTKELVSYSKKNVFVTKVTITDTLINLTRKKGNAVIEDDQLINNTEKTERAAAVSYYEDTKKYRELALSLTTAMSSNNLLSIVDKVVMETAGPVLDQMEIKKAEEKYCVYASGELKAIVDTKKEAEELAKNFNGLVVNPKGEKIWTFEENY